MSRPTKDHHLLESAGSRCVHRSTLVQLVCAALLLASCTRFGFGAHLGGDGEGAQSREQRDAGGPFATSALGREPSDAADSLDATHDDQSSGLPPDAQVDVLVADQSSGLLPDAQVDVLVADQSNGLAQPQEGGIAALVLDGMHDACDSALVIDFLTTRTFTVDTATAVSDYPTSCGGGTSGDVVAEILNAPLDMMLTCTGGGSLTFANDPSGGGTCPPQGGTHSMRCDGGVYASVFVQPADGFVVFCRDGELPPAIVTLEGPS